MKLETAQLLSDTAWDSGIESEVREDYSGRGMYGESTSGVVVNSVEDFVRMVALTVAYIEDFDEREDFATEIQNIKTDSMGRSVIVY